MCLLGKLLLIIIILSNPFSGNAMALGFIIYFVIGYRALPDFRDSILATRRENSVLNILNP